MQIGPLGAELLLADGQIDITKLLPLFAIFRMLFKTELQ